MIIIRRALHYQTRRRESCINHKLLQPLERTATTVTISYTTWYILKYHVVVRLTTITNPHTQVCPYMIIGEPF